MSRVAIDDIKITCSECEDEFDFSDIEWTDEPIPTTLANLGELEDFAIDTGVSIECPICNTQVMLINCEMSKH